MPRTPEQAIATVVAQSKNGPPFRQGLCKMKTREAFGVASDGSDDAVEAWYRTDHRIDVAGAKAPRGAFLWWTGGSINQRTGKRHGHVAFADGKSGVHSVDAGRAGYWCHQPFGWFAQHWPALKFAGVSADIDGVLIPGILTPQHVDKPAPGLPTILDCTVALQRLAAKSKNPDAVEQYALTRNILGTLVTSDKRVKTPTTVDGVLQALIARRKLVDGAASNSKLTASIDLLRIL